MATVFILLKQKSSGVVKHLASVYLYIIVVQPGDPDGQV